MATRLHGFVQDVSAKLETAGVTNLTMLVGRNALSKHSEKRRVGWVMPGGKFVAPDQAAAKMPTGSTTQRVSLCKTNEANVIAFIYGGDDEATEVLLEQVVAAVCEVVGGKCEMPLWRWVTQEADQAGRILRTELIELNVTLRLPVASEIKPLRAIVSVDDTCGLMAGTEDEWTIGEEA